jgi:hypothetical protein
MRLTILISGSDPTVNHDYAVLWLDMGEQLWSREAHLGLSLPEWGELHDCGDMIVLCAPGSREPLCFLHGLQVNPRQEVSRADGATTWPHETGRAQTEWHWRLQAVDRTTVHAESALFTEDADGAHAPSLSAGNIAGATQIGRPWRL